MFFGNDIFKNKVHIDDSSGKIKYYCPICNSPLVRRMGEIKAHHFAHEKGKVCNDTWHYEEMCDWHILWQNRFPKEYREVVKQHNNIKHRADVLIESNKLVIEFQHSKLSIDEFKDRNSFYKSLGYKVIWIFDRIDDSYDDKICSLYNNKYEWINPDSNFRQMDVNTKDVIIYFELSEKEMNNTPLVRVTYAKEEFTYFETYRGGGLSIDQFVDSALNNPSQILPSPKVPDAPETIEDGKTVKELWNESYSCMYIKNLFTKDLMVVFGNDGEISTNYNGQITGKYAKIDYSKPTGYWGVGRNYIIKDQDKKIWSFIASCKDKEFEEQKKRKEELKAKIEAESKLREVELKRREAELQARRDAISKLAFNCNSIPELLSIKPNSPLYVKNLLTNKEYCIRHLLGLGHVSVYSYNSLEIRVGTINLSVEINPDYNEKVWVLLKSPKEIKEEIEKEKERNKQEEHNNLINRIKAWENDNPGYNTIDEIAHQRIQEKEMFVYNMISKKTYKLRFRTLYTKYVDENQLYECFIDNLSNEYFDYKIWKRVYNS